MAFPMVHLLIADQWAQDKPELRECPAYFLGALAPDAIHMREPIKYPHDKNITHLNALPASRFDTHDLLSYWQARRSPFDLGYAIHVLTDVLWVRFYKDTYPTLIVGGHTDNTRYYPDANRIDARLYAEHAARPRLCALLAQAAAPDDHPLLSKAEIEGWRDRVIESFGKEPDTNPLKVFSYDDIDRLILHSADGIDALLREAMARRASIS